MLDEKTPDQIIDIAMAERDKGRAASVIPLVRKAIEANPDHLRLWHILGLLYRALQDSAAAIDAFEHAARLAPNDPKIAHALARLAMEGGLPATARYDRARTLAPSDGEVVIGRAAAQLAQGQIDQAIIDLESVVQGSPNWYQGLSSLAEFRWMAGQRDRYTEGFERALKQHSGDAALWLALINQMIRVNQFREAGEVIARARQRVGNLRELDFYEATVASEIGDDERAEQLFDMLQPYTQIGISVRAMRHLLRTGRPDKAAALGEALTGHSQAKEMWPYLGLAWRIINDPRWNWLERDDRLVQTYDISGRLDFDRLARFLRTLHVAKADMAGQSVRGGTQTDGPLFSRIESEIRSLRQCLTEVMADHMRKLAPADPDHPVLRHEPGIVGFAGSWSVRLEGAGRHTNHIHPQGWYSSALYIALPDAEAIGDAPAGWLKLGEPPEELGLDLEPYRLIEPKVGTLALFPSIMWHGTVPFNRGERLTVAFDVAEPV